MTWSVEVGKRGYRVVATERPGTRSLYVRYWDAKANQGKGNWAWHSLKHHDKARAEADAWDLSGKLRTAAAVTAAGSLTVAGLFARFEREVVQHEAEPQRSEDRRRTAIWLAALGEETDIGTVDRSHLDMFVRARKGGTLTVPDHNLRGKVTGRTIGADLEFLRRVYNWAATLRGLDRKPLTTYQPVKGYEIPTTTRPKRPLASYDRWLTLRPHCEARHPLFGGFMDLVGGMGWRVSALCRLRVGYLQPGKRPDAPYGRIRKAGTDDKQGVEMYVPLSRELQQAARRLLTKRGPAAPTDPLFPAVDDPAKPWNRWYPRSLLEAAETAAGLEPIEGGDFHPYRRAWATARKHLPLADVAAAGGWQSTAALLRAYIHADPETMLAVVSETRRVRDVRHTTGRNPRNRSSNRSRPTQKRRGTRG